MEQRLDAILLLIERQGSQLDNLQEQHHDGLREQHDTQLAVERIEHRIERQDELLGQFAARMKEVGVRAETVEVRSKDTADLLNQIIRNASGGTLQVSQDISKKQQAGLTALGLLAMAVAVKITMTFGDMVWTFLRHQVGPTILKVMEKAITG